MNERNQFKSEQAKSTRQSYQDKRKQPFEISESFNDAFHQHQWVYYDYF